MAKATTKTEEKPNQEVAQIDYSQYAGTGLENVGTQDISIPFMVILQKGSPEVDEEQPEYIPGAKPGMIMNNVTKELHDGREKGITFIPCAFDSFLVEWRPRESGGGGLVMMHKDDTLLSKCTKNEKGQDVLPNGNILVKTAYHFGYLVRENGDREHVVIGMSSTQLKKSRQWMTLIMNEKMTGAGGQKFTPPMFAYKWVLKTTPEANEKGTWYGWKLDKGDLVKDPEVFQASLQLSKQSIEQRRLAPPTPTAGEIPY